jgi:hypothetical protein
MGLAPFALGFARHVRHLVRDGATAGTSDTWCKTCLWGTCCVPGAGRVSPGHARGSDPGPRPVGTGPGVRPRDVSRLDNRAASDSISAPSRSRTCSARAMRRLTDSGAEGGPRGKRVSPVKASAAKPDGPGRARTCDLGIKSPLLYQLSYRPSSPTTATSSPSTDGYRARSPCRSSNALLGRREVHQKTTEAAGLNTTVRHLTVYAS